MSLTPVFAPSEDDPLGLGLNGLPKLRQPGLAVPQNSVPVTMPNPNDPRYRPLHGLAALGPVLSQFAGIPTKNGLEPLESVRQLGQTALEAPQARYKQDLTTAETGQRMQQQQAQTDMERERVELEQAQAERDRALANKPPAPEKQTPEETTLHDLMTGNSGQPRINPQTNQPYSYLEAYGATKLAGEKPDKPPATPEGERPLSDAQIQQFNAGLGARYQANNPGKTAPPEFQLSKGATEKDFDRIDKLLGGTESAAATAAARANTEANQNATRDQKAADDRQKFAQPFQQAIDTASDANTYVNSGKPSGAGDYALMNEFQEMLVSGQRSGIRFTANEQNMLQNARGWADSLKAQARHAIGGTYFSDDQRKQILDVMNGVAKRAQKQIDDYDAGRRGQAAGGKAGGAKPKDLGAAPQGREEGSTGTLPDGTKVIVKGGRIVPE